MTLPRERRRPSAFEQPFRCLVVRRNAGCGSSGDRAVIVNETRYNITVGVSTTYVAEQSQPERNRYVFAYTITLRNMGRTGAQLLSRHWVITDASGRVQEVRGEGVVGERPRLEPGESYRYTSGAVLETPVGTMEGSYRMIADDGIGFEAPIPRFRLSVPNALH